MKTPGLSNLRYFIPETGEEGELSIERVSSPLEIDPEFKTDFEFDFEPFRKLNLELSNKSFELEPFDCEQLLNRLYSQANEAIINIRWLVRTIKLEIVVPNDDLKKMFISALRSGEKEALLFKGFKKLKVRKEDYYNTDYFKNKIYLVYTYSKVNMPSCIKKFLKINKIDKLDFLREMEKWCLHQLWELMAKFKNSSKFKDAMKFKDTMKCIEEFEYYFHTEPELCWDLIQ